MDIFKRKKGDELEVKVVLPPTDEKIKVTTTQVFMEVCGDYEVTCVLENPTLVANKDSEVEATWRFGLKKEKKKSSSTTKSKSSSKSTRKKTSSSSTKKKSEKTSSEEE